MADCLAAVITDFNRELELSRVPPPELAPASVLIRVEAATLCGTDAHRWQGHLRAATPFVPGHETCGSIALDKATEALRKMAAFQEIKPLILPRVSN